MIEFRQIPGNQRAFFHKKLLGGIIKFGGGLIPGAGPVIDVATGFFPSKGGRKGKGGRNRAFDNVVTPAARRCPSGFDGSSLTFDGKCISVTGGVPIALPGASFAPSGGSSTCTPPAQMINGACTDLSGGARTASGGGFAVMGRYGAAYVPGSKIIDRAVCLPGDVVANDGLCYPKKSLTNKERQWPAGRRPLLTGGEMRAISIASRAATRLERTTKRLQKMGMMKKAGPRRIAAPRPHTLQIKDSH